MVDYFSPIFFEKHEISVMKSVRKYNLYIWHYNFFFSRPGPQGNVPRIPERPSIPSRPNMNWGEDQKPRNGWILKEVMFMQINVTLFLLIISLNSQTNSWKRSNQDISWLVISLILPEINQKMHCYIIWFIV